MPGHRRHGAITPARVGRIPARVVNIRSRRNNPNTRIRLDKLLRSTQPRICIKRRLGGIGDVLMTTPLTKAIKVLIPHCQLIYATDLKYSQGALGDIIKHNPYVDELIPFDQIRDGEYDYSVDITTTGLSQETRGSTPPNRIDMFADEVGVDISPDPLPIYTITPKEHKSAKAYLKELIPNRTKKTKIVVVHARSNDARRTWPLKHVSELVDLLEQEDDVHVLLFDWGNDINRWKDRDTEKVHLVLNKPLPETAAIVEQCNVVVCPDSSMLHIAGALSKKIVAVFGPIPSESRINYYANATAVELKLLCARCWYSPTCVRGNTRLQCLTDITPEMVREAVMKKLVAPFATAKSITYGKDLTNKKQDPIILIRRSTSGLGDLLMATPAIEAVKTKYPGKEVHLAVQRDLWPAVQNNPNIDKILDIHDPVNLKRYFMVIDVSSPCARYESSRVSSGRPVQKSRVEIFAEAMGVRDTITSITPRYYVTPAETEWAKEFIDKTVPKSSTKPKIAIGLQSAEIYRDWPEEYYPRLFELLIEHFEIIVLSHSRTHTFNNIIDACGFELRKALAIMSECDGLITVDTSLLHFGAALDLPTIALFGPIDYRARCKGYLKTTVVKSDMKCVPCWRNRHMVCKETNIVKGYSECLRSIRPKTIARIALEKFGSN